MWTLGIRQAVREQTRVLQAGKAVTLTAPEQTEHLVKVNKVESMALEKLEDK